MPPVLEWAIFKADWTGDTRADCSREGACWVFIQTRFGQFMYGFYPTELRWRVDAAAWLAIIGAAPLFLRQMPHKLRYGLGYLLVYPLLAYWHDSRDDDPALAWLRERIADAVIAATGDTLTPVRRTAP